MFSKQLFLHKECIGGLKTNLRSHAKTCLLITCSCKNHEKMNKHAHLDDIQRYGWGTLAHLSWTSIGLMCFPSGFWGYLAEILKNTEKVQSIFQSYLYSAHLLWHPNHKQKKTKTIEKTKKTHKPRENQKNAKNKKNKKTKNQSPDRNPDFSQNLLFFLRFFRFCRCSKAEKIPKDATETFG